MSEGGCLASGSLVFCCRRVLGKKNGLMEDIHYNTLLAP